MNDVNITITIGETVIPATLNQTLAAREFAKRLPFTVRADRGEFDYCGATGDLPHDPAETRAGWKNGDIGYARGWFALFFGGEERSSGYTSEMIIGRMDAKALDALRGLGDKITIAVDRAE